MSNTVITNYTDLNGPSTKADSSVVVIVNKDGSLSVDQNLLGTLMGSDGSQAAISVVRVGHEGKPDDATDSESDDDKVPHVTLSVDSYYNEPNSIIKYDSGAEMLQSLRIETRENSLLGFQNDHCYTLLTSSDQGSTPRSDRYAGYDDPVIEITHNPPPKPNPNPKKSKITILEQQIIPKGKKLMLHSSQGAVVLKGNDALNNPLPALSKSKLVRNLDKQSEESSESSSISSSGDSIPDRDSDSDYQDAKDKSGSFRKTKLKPRILQKPAKSRLDPKVALRLKSSKNTLRKEIRENTLTRNVVEKRQQDLPKESLLRTEVAGVSEPEKTPKQIPKQIKKDRKTPSHVTALLSDMTALFSAPDVIRRISTDGKTPSKTEAQHGAKQPEMDRTKSGRIIKHKILNPTDKVVKSYDPIPQLDDASLAQILQDTSGITKGNSNIPTVNTMSSSGLAGPLSPTLDLLGGLQPEEEGLSEDLLMHVAQLVESSDNLKEVIDKQVLGKVDVAPKVAPVQLPFQQEQSGSLYSPSKSVKNIMPRKDPIEIVRRDGRVITLPPIEAPATRASKRKSQVDSSISSAEVMPSPAVATLLMAEPALAITPEPQVQHVSKQYTNKKITQKKPEQIEMPAQEKTTAESQESWNSEDDPYRLWCICKQPHNNRFMICCDGCEDWFHGKCVNITKAMGQQMEEQGIEWRCPNCIKKAKAKTGSKPAPPQKKLSTGSIEEALISMQSPTRESPSKTSCIVCKKAARASSIYCSDGCILKHAQDSLGTQTSTSKGEEAGKPSEPKGDSRVIVYERKSGRLLAGPNAPTAENLKTWLQKHPTFEVVRPGTLSTIKPSSKKKSLNEPNRLQTTLNFERIPRKSSDLPTTLKTPEPKERMIKLIPAAREDNKAHPKTPVTPKTPQYPDMAKPSTSTARFMSEPRKRVINRQQPAYEKAPSVSPSTSRRKDPPTDTKKKMQSTEPIRDNVKKVLQEQISSRMAESKGQKFTEDEIKQFAIDIETELYELFRDVGMKYKAKYRSLMFNIKDRKNLSLWQKICERKIKPKELVRFSPEELASQELAEWRDQESKHQLELIKKSELDLLAASKTYVLKTHKGEEVMETTTAVSTELDPNEVPVEDVVSALNEEAADEQTTDTKDTTSTTDDKEKERRCSSRRKDKSESSSKKSSREFKRDSDIRKSRSSRRQSEMAEKEERSRRSDKKSKRRSSSRDKSKAEKDSKDSRRRSRSRASRRQSKSREHSRSTSQTRDGSRFRTRSKRRSDSQDKSSKRRQSTRNKHSSSTEDKVVHRSRSQETSQSKSKHDSTDSDSVERPKSAMQKELHPEYDPHEPMITSAFSDEDLRKSKDDVFDESFNKDLGDFGPYDPSKSFSIDTSLIMGKSISDKASGAESDQEPSSTVDNSSATVWNGCINMVDVARFYVAAHEVSGSCSELEEDLNTELDIVGRINPDTVWEYISKMKKTSNKDIVILRMQAANDEEKMQYIALYSYLSSRNRLGVVKVSNTANVKDIYIVPLPASTPLPSVLLPLEGSGIGENKMHLLIAIIIRQRKKRVGSLIPQDIIPAKVVRASRKRSYTPPVVSKGSYTPPTSPRRRALPLPSYTSPALSTTVKDKIAASLAAADEDEAYSPGSSSSGGSVTPAASLGLTAPPANSVLRTKMEELNRQIEEQKQQILKMAQVDSSVAEDDEAYSPSRPMTPPSVNPLADISLPSNLQEILATIKQRSENTSVGDVDMRNLPLPQ